MKNIICDKTRYQNLISQLIQMAKGDLTHKIQIKGHNDSFEELEVLINLINEEWYERMLHLALIKPSEFQRYNNHFQIVLDNRFVIRSISDTLCEYFNVEMNVLLGSPFREFLDKKSGDFLMHQLTLRKELGISDMTVKFISEHFRYSYNLLNSGEFYIINLYKFHVDVATLNVKDDNKIEKNRVLQQFRHRKIIEQIKDYIDHCDLREPLKLPWLCKEFGINKNHLSFGFKSLYKCTVYEYFTRLRMERAHLLILNSNISLKEVSLRIGYQNYPNFSDAFLKHYNFRPDSVRNNNKK